MTMGGGGWGGGCGWVCVSECSCVHCTNEDRLLTLRSGWCQYECDVSVYQKVTIWHFCILYVLT